LDDESKELEGMTLHDAMIELRHPTNKKFNLFHTIDKHFCKKCHVLMVLKLAESQAHAMIVAMLPYLLWQHAKSQPNNKTASAIKMVQTGCSPLHRQHFLVPEGQMHKKPE